VIDELFDFADLHRCAGIIVGLVKVTVTGTYHKDLSASERSAIITLYEKMEKLVEAAHVMHESRRKFHAKALKAKAQREEISDSKTTNKMRNLFLIIAPLRLCFLGAFA
jgi:hypothetical protein